MTDLFKRDIKVIAGTLTIEPRTATGENQPILAMRFDITKTNNREPNKCELTVWNLKAESRAKLQEEGLEVIIQAGYVDEINQIFKGDLESATTGRDAVNWITMLELGDGSKRMKSSRINESFRGGQPVGQMLKRVAETLGLDPGNLQEKVDSDGARSVLKELINMVVLSGKSMDVLDEIASSMGLNVSVQDKALQFLAKGEVLAGPAINLSASTGMLGSPEVGEKGVVSAMSLLNGRFKPGGPVSIDSRVISGDFVAQKVQHVGHTWGDEWTSGLELNPQ